jgi:hypothetical protein
MSPKEFAEYLVERMFKAQSDKMADYSSIYYPTAKVLARICLDEIYKNNTDESKNDYWVQVSNELDNL